MTFDDLMNVPVKAAGKTEQTIAEIPASTVIITRKEIEQYGYRNLREVLNNIPGYYALSNLGIDIYGVRGYAKEKGNNFIIMINDTKITDDKILTNYQVPVESIERIEVVRGPMAVMYGNNAFFGVINIITENENPDKENNNLFLLSYGTWNTFNSAFRIGTKQKDLRLNIDFGYYLTDGMDKPLADMMRRPEKMDEPLFEGVNGDGLALPLNARRTKEYLNKTQKVIND
ncbi:MAG: TonB-dependent receptor plug domain-containing protein [Chloroflexia bacterium]|nr:TonB-dependent receptor plug domain-containing protein [Chloroflexia bacterium]